MYLHACPSHHQEFSWSSSRKLWTLPNTAHCRRKTSWSILKNCVSNDEWQNKTYLSYFLLSRLDHCYDRFSNVSFTKKNLFEYVSVVSWLLSNHLRYNVSFTIKNQFIFQLLYIMITFKSYFLMAAKQYHNICWTVKYSQKY